MFLNTREEEAQGHTTMRCAVQYREWVNHVLSQVLYTLTTSFGQQALAMRAYAQKEVEVDAPLQQ